MNKLKELWGENKVLMVLGLILIICIITIAIVFVSFFFGGKDDRPSKINVPISEEIKEGYITKLEDQKSVEEATISVTKSGVINIHIKFVSDTALVDAQSVALKSLENISDDILNEYDLNFYIKCEKNENSEGFSLIGARNVASKDLKWDNNTPVESEE